MQRINRFEVVDELGRGAESIVFSVRDPKSGERFALKMLAREPSAGHALAGAEEKPNPFAEPHDHEEDGPRVLVSQSHSRSLRAARFLREFAMLARFAHPNIVRVFERGLAVEHQPFFTMEIVDGVEAGEWLARVGALNTPERTKALVTVVLQVASALNEVHAQSVVHRGLRPDHLRVTDSGSVKVIGFPQTLNVDRGFKYTSPEQALGADDVDHRADLYSLGMILYELLAGRHPFDADTAIGFAYQYARVAPPAILSVNRGAHPGLAEVCHRLIQKNSAARFQSADELTAAMLALNLADSLVH